VNVKDVKCDDMGSLGEQQQPAVLFQNWQRWLDVEMVDKTCSGNVVALKRDYCQLNDGIHNNMRRRIDTIHCKYNTYLIFHVFIVHQPLHISLQYYSTSAGRININMHIFKKYDNCYTSQTHSKRRVNDQRGGGRNLTKQVKRRKT
jgi:hypothetical protein